MIKNERIEAICDNLANVIDEAEGQTDVGQAISSFLNSEDEITRDVLIKKFEELYLCNPYVYAENSSEDALWNSNHSIPEINDEFDHATPIKDIDEIL